MRVPDWAHFLADPDRYRAFIDAIERAVEQLEVDLELGEGSLRLRSADANTLVSVGLKSLAQRWHALGPAAASATGEALIRAHLESVGARLQVDPQLEAQLDNLEWSRQRLRLRLFNERAAVALALGLVQRRLTRGLFAALAVDLPTSLRPVEPARLARWGSSLDALWDEALEQTLAMPVQAAPLRLFDRVPCLAITGDSLVTTSHVLGLERVLEAEFASVPVLGAVVVVPNRHTLLAYPLGVHDIEVSVALEALTRAGGQLYEQGPASLSPELNWWRAGSLEHLRTGRDPEGRLLLGASEAFMTEVVGQARS